MNEMKNLSSFSFCSLSHTISIEWLVMFLDLDSSQLEHLLLLVVIGEME